MATRMTPEERRQRAQRGRRKQEDADKQRGKLGILVGNTYVFWNTAHTGYCYCRIEHGVETEIAECIPKTALDPYARVVFVREGPALVAVDPNSLDAVNVYGQSAPALRMTSQPMADRGSGDWTPFDGNILVGDGVQFTSTSFVDAFETIIGYLRTGGAAARTISGGVLTLGDETVVIVSPETGTTDNLDTIVMGDSPREVWLLAASGATITIRTAIDNLFVSSGTNLDFTDQRIAFLYHDTLDGFVLSSASASAGDFPKRATLFHDEAIALSGTLGTIHDNSQIYGFYTYFGVGSANGDSFSNSCLLRAGTYTLSALGITNNDGGKLDITLDGVPIVTGQDWYSPGVGYNVVKTATVTVTTDGYHVLQGTVNGKNGSSAGYALPLTKYWFEQAAD